MTIPAGDTAEVAVTFNPLAGSPLRAYSGMLTVTGCDDVARTAIGRHLEPEMHDVTLNVKARTGSTPSTSPRASTSTSTPEASATSWSGGRATGTYTVRVVPGRYEFMASVHSGGAAPSDTVVTTDVTVGHTDPTVEWDATKGTLSSVDFAEGNNEVPGDNLVVVQRVRPKIATGPLPAITGTTILLFDGQVVGTSDEPCHGDFEIDSRLSGTFTLRCAGGTWKTVPVGRVGDHGVAKLKHPGGGPPVHRWPSSPRRG